MSAMGAWLDWEKGGEEKSFLNLLENIDRINSFCTLSSQSNSQRWSDSRHKELDSTSNGETKTFGSHLVYPSFHNQMLKDQYRWQQHQRHNWQGSSDLRCHFHTPLCFTELGNEENGDRCSFTLCSAENANLRSCLTCLYTQLLGITLFV